MSSQRSTLHTSFAGEQGGLPPVAGADLEHPAGRREVERLHHLRDERWLRRHLVVRDRQRRIVVGMRGEIRRDELRPRDGGDGFEQTRVTHAGGTRGGDEIRRLSHGRSPILLVMPRVARDPREGEPSLPRCP
jgi:hypothetical protein